METINWSGYEWITQERWGQVHPEKWFQWYDSSAVKIDDSDRLHLLTHKNPKKFEEIEKVSPIGVGLVSNLTRFSYGSFEICAKLPKGKFLWPAFWMYSWSSWPPEIDVFEGYSGKNVNYFNLDWKDIFNPRNIHTNIHWLNNGKHDTTGGGRGKLNFFKNPTKNFIKYRLDWYPDRIELFWNNKIVRLIDDKEVMKCFQNIELNVIINNAVMWGVDFDNPTESDFVIESFKYIPL